MELIKNGINKGSHIYFYTPPLSAKKLLYYPVAAGEFYCNSQYNVTRESYNSILVICVLDGSITMLQDGNEATAEKGELLLIDCYKEHRYFSKTCAHTLWVHFDGNNSRLWFDEIYSRKGQKSKCSRQTADCIQNVIKYINSSRDEYDISNELYSMLCSIGRGNDSEHERKKADSIERAKSYILSNYDKSISVYDIAGSVHLSASFFSKVFKESTGFSPYDYLLSIRLDKAKELLQQTDDSVQNIAFKTGFNSTSNFICFFKKETGISPLKFRKIEF